MSGTLTSIRAGPAAGRRRRGVLFGGEVIIAQVLGLPSTGPLLLDALESEDMYLAGSIILIVSVLTVVGTLISDILLAVVDPRIREGLAGAR